MVGVFAFLLVLVPVFQVRASVSVAFIYSSDLASAESYGSLLTANGMTVDLVPSSDAATWDYSSYGLIVIGAETGAFYSWEPEAAVSAIDGTGKPILGLGTGGSSFFSVLDIYIDWGQCWVGSQKSLYAVDVGHQIFQSPNQISIPSDNIIDVYSGSTRHLGVYMPSPVEGVTPLGREVTDSNHYPLIQQDDRYVLWGFDASPAAMTQTGKNLFVNVVSWLAPQPALQNPSASFTNSPLSPEVGETVTFDASGSSDPDGTIVGYEWSFGDEATATGITASHSYSSAGTYTVTLTVTDNNGLTGTTTKSVTVAPHEIEPQAPSASFTSSPHSPEVGETVSFDASGSSDPDGTIVNYIWDFGDGNTGAGKTAAHSYDSEGTYTVTLTVEDNDGNTDTETKSITVPPLGLKAPIASFTSSPSSPEVGQTVSFDASGSNDPDGTIVGYEWNFGDGSTGTGETASHAYSSAGTYTVEFAVTDNDGLTDVATKSITVTPLISPTQSPVASFTHSPLSPEEGESVSFDASGSSDPDGTIVNYIWDFGDGNTGAGKTATHSYDSEGTYTVTLTVEDNDENTADTTRTIKVTEVPGPDEAEGFPYWILIPIIVAIVIAALVIWYFLKKKKPKEEVPKPIKFRITAEPAEILADGKTKSVITVELLDKDGKLVPAPANTEIKLTTTMGKIEKPVVQISKGKEKEQTLLVSPREGGTATLSAIVEDLGSTNVTVTFMEKKRYCMHCGKKMAYTAKKCSDCGKSPPAGVDTKVCNNCKAVIPIVANFCPECGASQPKD